VPETLRPGTCPVRARCEPEGRILRLGTLANDGKAGPTEVSLPWRFTLGSCPPHQRRFTVTGPARGLPNGSLELVVQIPRLVGDCRHRRVGSDGIVSRSARVQTGRDSNHHIILVAHVRIPFRLSRSARRLDPALSKQSSRGRLGVLEEPGSGLRADRLGRHEPAVSSGTPRSASPSVVHR
jgi:hypothetical protein